MKTIVAIAGYSTVVVLIRLLKDGSSPVFDGSWPLLPGVIFGTQFFRIDEWVIRYLREKGFLIEFHLLTQNILFAYGWIVIAFFGITSTTSLFGKGFVMGIGLQLAAAGLKAKGQGIREEQAGFFWPIKRTLSETEQKWAIGIYLLVFVLFTLMI